MQPIYKNNSIRFFTDYKEQGLNFCICNNFGTAMIEITGLWQPATLNFSKSVSRAQASQDSVNMSFSTSQPGNKLGKPGDILNHLRVGFWSSRPPTKLSTWPSPLARPQILNPPAGLSLLAGWGILKNPGALPSEDALCRVTETIPLFQLTMAVPPVGDASEHVRHPKHPHWLLLGGMSPFASSVTRGTTGPSSDAATWHWGHPERCRRNLFLSLSLLGEENQGWQCYQVNPT